ncbi:GNAT family N-acetyltransferase [Exiguobacterium sp. A1_3_1]
MELNVTFREATIDDLNNIVKMLADDELGKEREHCSVPLLDVYIKSFQAISNDPNNELIVAYIGDEVVGVQQITFIPYLTHQGGWRATVEGVRVASSVRGRGIGTLLIKQAIDRAKERGCHLIQLTTNKKRKEALRFYERLGFTATHEGLKQCIQEAKIIIFFSSSLHCRPTETITRVATGLSTSYSLTQRKRCIG